MRKGQNPDAIGDYERAIALKPAYDKAHNNMGEAYENLNMLDRALEFYNKAIDLNPRYVRAYVNRGDIHDKRATRTAPSPATAGALDFDPVHKGALEALAKLGATP